MMLLIARFTYLSDESMDHIIDIYKNLNKEDEDEKE